MTLKQCKGNCNYMYEWMRGIDEDWFPCHIINDRTDDECVCILTRNETILYMSPEEVRKLSEEDYIRCRDKYVSFLGKHYEQYGFHETLEEDLELFREASGIIP